MPAYNSFFPTNYQPYTYQPYQTQQPPQQSNSGIVWVQGEAGAKSYLVGAGQSVLLMDSESSSFYIKSTDTSGMPLPLRIFDYTERKADAPVIDAPKAESVPQVDLSGYVTREELQEELAKLTERRKEKHNG